MTLSRNNLFVRFAFLGDSWSMPNQVSLCALFWRIVGRLVIVAAIATMIGVYFHNLYAYTRSTLITTSAVLAGLGFWLLIVWLQSIVDERNANPNNNLIALSFKAIKNRFCPIIRIEK